MTYREDFTLPTELLEQVSQQGFDILPELIRIVVNAAIQLLTTTKEALHSSQTSLR